MKGRAGPVVTHWHFPGQALENKWRAKGEKAATDCTQGCLQQRDSYPTQLSQGKVTMQHVKVADVRS